MTGGITASTLEEHETDRNALRELASARLNDGGLVERRGFILRRLTVAADVVALLITGLLAYEIVDTIGRQILAIDVYLYLAFIPVWPVLAILLRAYHSHSVGRGLTVNIADEIGPIFLVCTCWSWFFIVGRSLANTIQIQLIHSLLIWAISIPVVVTLRSLVRLVARHRGWYLQKVLVVGHSLDASRIVSRIRRHPEWGLEVVDEIDVAERDEAGRDDRPSAELDGAVLMRRAIFLDVCRVIFATPPNQLDARTDLTRALIESGTQVDFVPGEAEILRSGATVSHLEGLPLMSMPGAMPPRTWGAIKRILDLMIAVPTVLVAAPVLAVAAVWIRLDSPGNILYKQRRAGLHGRPFSLLKLRTMHPDADSRLSEFADRTIHPGAYKTGMFKIDADPRVTRSGSRLRRFSIDELPQLWNVVRGDMSLVGPRPLPVAEDQRVAGHYELRRHVRPGMTGPWQVNGRSDIPFHDMLRLDYSYVLNWSISSDIKLLLQTSDAVVRGKGAY